MYEYRSSAQPLSISLPVCRDRAGSQKSRPERDLKQTSGLLVVPASGRQTRKWGIISGLGIRILFEDLSTFFRESQSKHALRHRSPKIPACHQIPKVIDGVSSCLKSRMDATRIRQTILKEGCMPTAHQVHFDGLTLAYGSPNLGLLR